MVSGLCAAVRLHELQESQGHGQGRAQLVGDQGEQVARQGLAALFQGRVADDEEEARVGALRPQPVGHAVKDEELGLGPAQLQDHGPLRALEDLGQGRRQLEGRGRFGHGEAGLLGAAQQGPGRGVDEQDAPLGVGEDQPLLRVVEDPLQLLLLLFDGGEEELVGHGHLVEGPSEGSDLVPAGDLDLHVEVPLADLAHGLGQARQGPDDPAHDEHGAEHRQDRGAGRDGQDLPLGLAQGLPHG